MAAIARAAAVIRSGGIVAYPTEAVYGLGCDPRNRRAVMRLLRVKRRAANKGLILIAADARQLAPYVDVRALPEHVRATWPGPVTWLLPAKARVPRWLRGRHDNIAVRVTAHPLAAALCRQAGMAIVSTSANRSGQQPMRTDREAARIFPGALDYIVRGRTGRRRKPSEIRDAGNNKIVRTG